MDAVETARALVAERFPGALAAFLGGSTARGTATATSDLDIVVVVADPRAPWRETLRAGGRLVELFVHTPDSLARFYAGDAREHRCALADMCASGIVLAGGEDAAGMQRAAARLIAAGPPALSDAELEDRRYFLSDALDDLAGGRDADETAVIAGQVLVLAAELALLGRGRWLGAGKWLLRRLRDSDPETADALVGGYRAAVATGDAGALVAAAERVLSECGGRRSEGYRRAGEPR